MSKVKANDAETEVRHLRREIQSLHDELAQCQGDKDFVWTLWKRLQSSDPDVAQAVGLVYLREKQKTESRSRQVLELLDSKDKYIDELQLELEQKNAELHNVLSRKQEYEEKVSHLEGHLETLRNQLQLLTIPQPKETANEQSDLYSKHLQELAKTLQEKIEAIEKLQTENKRLRHERDNRKDKLQHAKAEINDIKCICLEMTQEFRDMKKQLKKAEQQVKGKEAELQIAKTQLDELWHTHQQTAGHMSQQADLIRQLQAMQETAEHKLKDMENDFEHEIVHLQKEVEDLSRAKAELCEQIEDQEKMIQIRDDIITDLEDQLNAYQCDGSMTGSGVRFIRCQEEEYEVTRDTRRSRSTGRRKTGRKSSDPTAARSLSQGTLYTGTARPRSLSASLQHGEKRMLIRKVENLDKRLADAYALLQLKKKELNQLHSAHGRRLERLHTLQAQHRLVKKQLAIAEEEIHGSKAKKRRSQPVLPKDLQKEDSDAVWNELTAVKKENRNLARENTNVQEELDSLKVQLAHLEASKHELRTQLENEQHELKALLESRNDRAASKTKRLEEQVARLEDQLIQYSKREPKLKERIEELQTEYTQLEEQHRLTLTDTRALKDELSSLQRDEAHYRITIVDLNNQIEQLKRDVVTALAKDVPGSASARQYQKVLDKSVEEMNHLFKGYRGPPGHSESDDIDHDIADNTLTSGTSGTGDSLGHNIVHQATKNHTINKPVYHTISTQTYGGQSCRSVALSPVHFPDLLSSHSAEDQGPVRSVSWSGLARSSPRSTPGSKTHVVSSRKSASGSGHSSKGVLSLKQRVSTLQHQVSAIRESKRVLSSENSELKSRLAHLEVEVQTANQRLNSSRLTVQRLNLDIDRLKVEKEEIEKRLTEVAADSNQHSEADWNSLHARLKNVNSDLSRQQQQLKDLKLDHELQCEKNIQLQDRLKSLERDNNQKRVLMDDLRARAKTIEQQSQTNTCLLEEKTAMINSLSDTNNRLKTQVESLKTRISAINKNKSTNEDKVVQLTEEMDRKSKQVLDLQARLRKAQNDMSGLELSVQKQFTQLADQSEAAMDAAQKKLSEASLKIQTFNKLFKKLYNYLERSLVEERRKVTEMKAQLASRVSSARTEDVAEHEGDVGKDELRPEHYGKTCEILGMTMEELEDFMSGAEGSRNQSQQVETPSSATDDMKNETDAKWRKRWEKALLKPSNFADELFQLVVEKTEERCDIIRALVSSMI